MDLSIIIVNWNSAAYTAECVSSIRAATRGLQYEIIVVDNASTDNSIETLKLLPDVTLVASSHNAGFARANNLGYQHASGKALLFLNPDTYVQDAAIDRMYCAMLSSEKVGIVGCRLLNSDQSLQTSCVQAFPTIMNQLTDVEAIKLRFPWVRMWGISALFQNPRPLTSVEVVSGACLMIRRNVFEQVVQFSTDYFMYCEDVDLCYKVIAAGYQVAYVDYATVVHFGGQSSKQASKSSFAHVMAREAIRIFLAKRRSSLYAATYKFSMFVSAVVRLAMLAFLLCIGKDQAAVAISRRKWRSILSWSVGREGWTQQLGRAVDNTAQTPSAKTA